MPASKVKRAALQSSRAPQDVVDSYAADDAACDVYVNALISDCERALREENFLAICRMHYVLKELATQKGRLWNKLKVLYPNLPGDIERVIVEWKKKLKLGDKVDVFVSREQKWYEGTVRKAFTDEVGKAKVEIKFKAWDDKYNNVFDVVEGELVCKEAQTRLKSKTFIEEGFIVVDAEASEEALTKQAPEEKVWVSGRGYVSASEAESHRKRQRTGREEKAAVQLEAKVEEEPASKARPSKKRMFVDPATGEAVEEDDNDWFCTECSLMESRDGSDLLLCDGPCLRSWHHCCLAGLNLNLKKIRTQAGDWLCSDCASNEHACFVCKQRGLDNAPGGVWKCKLKECGKYFHEQCLGTDAFLLVKVRRDPATAAISFTCPRHLCDTCHPFYGSKGGGIVTCLHCPRGFHDQCVLPGSRYNEIYLLCPSHPNEVLPSLDKIGRSEHVDYASSESQMFERMILPPSTALPSVSDDAAAGHFRLPIQYKEDISSGEPVFKSIRRLDYDALPDKVDSLPYHPPEECCNCRSHCGPDCLNRISKVECCEPFNGELVCRAMEPPEDKDKDSKAWHKKNCGNRCLQNSEYAQMERFREHAMGWGMRAAEDIAEGRLVVEYVGEVIDEAMMRARMEWQRQFSPSDHDFYIMQIDNGFYVDGKFKGNESRFINHSCDPNCELERYNVKGRMRIGIFATKHINRGDALSYDYQFDTMESEQFKCYCGAEICRGTMAPKKKGNKGSLSNAERKRLVALGRAKERKAAGKGDAAAREAELRRSYTGRCLPGDPFHPMAEGAPRQTFQIGRQTMLFLPRAVRRGADFRTRQRALRTRGCKAAKRARRGK